MSEYKEGDRILVGFTFKEKRPNGLCEVETCSWPPIYVFPRQIQHDPRVPVADLLREIELWERRWSSAEQRSELRDLVAAREAAQKSKEEMWLRVERTRFDSSDMYGGDNLLRVASELRDLIAAREAAQKAKEEDGDNLLRVDPNDIRTEKP